MHIPRLPTLLALLLTLTLSPLSLAQPQGQSPSPETPPQPSPTPRRRSLALAPAATPTSLADVSDPEMLRLLAPLRNEMIRHVGINSDSAVRNSGSDSGTGDLASSRVDGKANEHQPARRVAPSARAMPSARAEPSARALPPTAPDAYNSPPSDGNTPSPNSPSSDAPSTFSSDSPNIAQPQPLAETRSRRRKVTSFGHEADLLPLTNAERMRLGLPLKPPVHKKKAPQPTPTSTDADFHDGDGDDEGKGNWFGPGTPF